MRSRLLCGFFVCFPSSIYLLHISQLHMSPVPGPCRIKCASQKQLLLPSSLKENLSSFSLWGLSTCLWRMVRREAVAPGEMLFSGMGGILQCSASINWLNELNEKGLGPV